VNLFYQPEIALGVHHLDMDESRHAVKVLRMKPGEIIELTDGLGNFYKATITNEDSKKCSFTRIEKKVVPARSFYISIALAPTKNTDRTEWFVEKAVEIGVEEIHFIQCKNSERKTLNLERIHRIAISALKQSGQAWLPKISELVSFQQILSVPAKEKFICHVDTANPHQLKTVALPNSNYLVLIGPEGDFSSDEINTAIAHGFKKVSLGPNRLRTETAALTACQTLNLINL
jgi:16S rRNA (uracil1498-N3)-methyltransferase